MKSIYNKLLKKSSINMIRFINIIIFILFSVFLNNSFHKFFYVFYLFVSFIINFISYRKKYFSVSKYEVCVFFGVLISILVSYLYGFNVIYNVSASFLFLFSCYFDFYKNEFEFVKKYKSLFIIINRLLYIVILLLLIYDLIYHFCILNFKFGMDYNFLAIGDKNYSGIILFIFFYFCYKNKYLIGTILTLIFFIFIRSRMIFLALILFVILELILKLIKRELKYKNVFLLMLLVSGFFMIFVSYYWVEKHPASSIGEYKKSFNDGSNAIRVRSNIYAVNTIVNDYRFIYSGYDKNILKELGIEEDKDANQFLGFRIVQPHHFILNIILRYGIILSIFYILILNCIVNRLINKNNFSFIAVFVFMNMFMHSLLLYPYLIFFLYVLTSNHNKKNGRKLFICDNYNHLLLTIIRRFIENEKFDILICNNWQNDNLMNDKNLIDRLKDSKLFNKVLVDNYYYSIEKKIMNSNNKDFKKMLLINKRLFDNKTDFELYNEVYIYYDVSEIGKVLNIKKIKYNLLEDGTDCFKNNSNVILTNNSLRNIIKKYLFKYPVTLGSSKYIKMIEVNDNKGLFIKHKNIIVNNKAKMFSSINKKQKNIINNLFLPNIDFKNLNGKDLIITQPLFIDNFLEKKKDQVLLYKKIINDYCNNGVIIKVHPRDKIDYSSFKDEYIIKDKFPIEILNYFDEIKFNKVITISSTSINQIKNCKERVVLGWNYLDKYKEELKNGKRKK